MRPVLRTLLSMAAVGVALLGGFAGGWFAHPATSLPSGPATLAVIAAGSLAPSTLLPAMITAFASATPGVSAPVSAQLYEGSSSAATALASGHQPYDLFVSADFRVIPGALESLTTPVASWEVVFASDPVVLAYNGTDSALSGIDSSNWASKIVQPGVVLGTPNASADPLGANAILTLELEDAAQALGGTLYGHFFSGGVGAAAHPTSATKVVTETAAATALDTGLVSVYLIYRSYAVADHLSYVVLGSNVDLGGTAPANVSAYGNVSTRVVSSSGGLKTVVGAPVLFGLTVPSTAPDTVLGEAFAAFLLSNASVATWAGDGFEPLPTLWTDQPGRLPAALSGSAPDGVASLPSYLSALLS